MATPSVAPAPASTTPGSTARRRFDGLKGKIDYLATNPSKKALALALGTTALGIGLGVAVKTSGVGVGVTATAGIVGGFIGGAHGIAEAHRKNKEDNEARIAGGESLNFRRAARYVGHAAVKFITSGAWSAGRAALVSEIVQNGGIGWGMLAVGGFGAIRGWRSAEEGATKKSKGLRALKQGIVGAGAIGIGYGVGHGLANVFSESGASAQILLGDQDDIPQLDLGNLSNPELQSYTGTVNGNVITLPDGSGEITIPGDPTDPDVQKMAEKMAGQYNFDLKLEVIPADYPDYVENFIPNSTDLSNGWGQFFVDNKEAFPELFNENGKLNYSLIQEVINDPGFQSIVPNGFEHFNSDGFHDYWMREDISPQQAEEIARFVHDRSADTESAIKYTLTPLENDIGLTPDQQAQVEAFMGRNGIPENKMSELIDAANSDDIITPEEWARLVDAPSSSGEEGGSETGSTTSILPSWLQHNVLESLKSQYIIGGGAIVAGSTVVIGGVALAVRKLRDKRRSRGRASSTTSAPTPPSPSVPTPPPTSSRPDSYPQTAPSASADSSSTTAGRTANVSSTEHLNTANKIASALEGSTLIDDMIENDIHDFPDGYIVSPQEIHDNGSTILLAMDNKGGIIIRVGNNNEYSEVLSSSTDNLDDIKNGLMSALGTRGGELDAVFSGFDDALTQSLRTSAAQDARTVLRANT